jgi:hypothetical protein
LRDGADIDEGDDESDAVLVHAVQRGVMGTKILKSRPACREDVYPFSSSGGHAWDVRIKRAGRLS